MKAGMDLIALATEIERRQKAKKDFLVKSDALEFTATGQEENATFGFLMGADQAFGLNDFCHGQVASHYGIPKPYYDRMRKEEPALLARNVNAWLAKAAEKEGGPEKRMIRTLDGKARAFLSDRYRPLENEDLANAVLPVLLDMKLDIMSSQITDQRLYIKAVHPKVTRELKAAGGKFGDGKHNIIRCLAPAITISNSEVGSGALSVLGGVYDGFCSNLASFGERSARKYHVGKQHDIIGGEETWAMLSDDTRKKTDAAMWSQVRDIVRGAFDEANFNSLCDKISETQTHAIDGDPVKVIELTSKRFRMQEEEGTSILRHLIDGGSLTRFGLYNAITRASQDIESYDRATEMERIGAQIIELPRAEWQTLAKAAA